jgi:cytidine deaminase
VAREAHSRPGDGTVWVVTDEGHDAHHCYWYTGASDDHLVERASVTTATEAVAWGRLRSGRVRIRSADGQTRWAGTAPRPSQFLESWTDETLGS